ncbi:YhcN/YlaJ family sporulation lipoprotein [Brevibacillus marinus]|uniref:YhcN/YlaJ family sporulation lipoprotein n=1 Tax=Brevibacillus marinus TaxID=2496837 RepID=UPI000F84A8A7|nr:YhcN/YlaJ family sporulation lipoprotein [Brevibacillus marinus]
MKKWLYPLSCLALVSTLAACGTSNGTNNGTANNPGTQSINQTRPGYNTFGNNPFGYNTYRDGWDRVNPRDGVYERGTAWNDGGTYGARYGTVTFDRQKAEQLARVADDVRGVDGAVALVRGNDAVIGIYSRLTANNPRQRQALERRVHAAVRAVDPTLNIRVTSDRNLLNRIRSMEQNQRNGNGTTGPTTVGGNLANAGDDFAALLRDLGRTVTAPFR